jgi:hypothetical protein
LGYPRGIREPASCQVASLKALISNTVNKTNRAASELNVIYNSQR